MLLSRLNDVAREVVRLRSFARVSAQQARRGDGLIVFAIAARTKRTTNAQQLQQLVCSAHSRKNVCALRMSRDVRHSEKIVAL